MRNLRSGPLIALIASGVLWGITVPLTKVALDGLGPMWLTVLRFGLAALPLLVMAGRTELRKAWKPKILAWGAVGYGAVIVLQSVGIARTSVAHASLIVGLVPVLGAIAAVILGRGGTGRTGWIGFGVAFLGIALVAGAGGGGATLSGDLLVFLSAALSAAFLMVQPGLLAGRRPLAVTAVQFTGAAIAAAPFAYLTEGAPAVPEAQGPLLALIGLVIAGTLIPYWLFAYAQAWVAPDLAGSFLNIEPVIGFGIGVVLFSDPFGPLQIAGGVAVILGLVLTALPQGGDDAPPPPPEGAVPAPRTERVLATTASV
ncbi:DMT family transporter [Actinocorallia aurea]